MAHFDTILNQKKRALKHADFNNFHKIINRSQNTCIKKSGKSLNTQD